MSIDSISMNSLLKTSFKYIYCQYNLFTGSRYRQPYIRFFSYVEISGYEGNYNGSFYSLCMYIFIDPPVFHGTMP